MRSNGFGFLFDWWVCLKLFSVRYARLIHVVQAIHVVLWLFLLVFVDSDRVEVFFVFGSFWSFWGCVSWSSCCKFLRCFCLFVLGRLYGFQMFWRASYCLRSCGCILVAHVVHSDSESCSLSWLYYFKLCFLSRSFQLVLTCFSCFSTLLISFPSEKWFYVAWGSVQIVLGFCFLFQVVLGCSCCFKLFLMMSACYECHWMFFHYSWLFRDVLRSI